MPYKVVITRTAANMLDRHIAFLAEVSKSAAADTKLAILKAANKLSEFPRLYPKMFAEHRDIEYRRCLVQRRYLLIYFEKGDTVYIDMVLDCRQDNDKYFA